MHRALVESAFCEQECGRKASENAGKAMAGTDLSNHLCDGNNFNEQWMQVYYRCGLDGRGQRIFRRE